MLSFEVERPGDARAREALLDTCFGSQRHRKTVAKLRRGRCPAEGLALVARRDGVLVGTVRLWRVDAGSAGPALLLGPIAVAPGLQGDGIGSQLMTAALARAKALGHRAVLLVGDAAYYRRFGFRRDLAADLALPGPVELSRFLALELVPGALAHAAGPVVATGEPLASKRRRAA
ncbi:MAG: N-acetyltransferase [Alphaproteobacteria bacterium]